MFIDSYKTDNLSRKLCLFLGFLIGFSFYIRFLSGVLAIGAIGSYLFVLAIEKKDIRGVLFLLIGLIFSYVTLGFAIFHNPKSILNYIIINNQLSFGNSVDMTVDVVSRIGTWVAVGLLIFTLNIYVFFKKSVFCLR